MKVYHNSFSAMGSRFNAVFPYEDDGLCEKLFHLIKNEVIRLEAKLSYFDEKSVVSEINRSASKSAIELDDEMFDVIKTSLSYSEKTSGSFDITMRPIIETILADKKNGNGDRELKSRLAEIELDDEQKTIRYKSDLTKIDFGGFGKGYALEKIKQLIINSSMETAFISFGESSILTKGKHPSGKKWSVGINDIFNPGESLYAFDLEDESISSSSNYYSDDSGRVQKKVNVINPFTAKPVDELGILSVKSSSPLEAEILSTAFLVMDDSQIQNAIHEFKNLEVVKILYNDNKPNIKYYN